MNRLRNTWKGRRCATSAILVTTVAMGCLALPEQMVAQNDSNWRESPSAAGEQYVREREVGSQVVVEEPRPAKAGATPERRAASATGPFVMPRMVIYDSDVQVNDSTLDTPDDTTQSETTLAVLDDTICAGFNDSAGGGLSGLARSTDLGETWTDLGGLGQSGDPVIAVHRASGTFYYAMIATVSGNPAIGVARSTNDCQSFLPPVDASPTASTDPNVNFNDKPWIAVDNTGGTNDGNIYACWTQFRTGGNPSQLWFSRSIDGGLTFQDDQIIQPGGTAPFGCSVAVGSDGAVHVAWADRDGANQDDIRYRRSDNAGLNFTATTSINSLANRHPGVDRITDCSPSGSMRPTLIGNIRMLHQAWIAVDTTGGPFNGNLYAVWASDPADAGSDHSDVFFSRSTDNGANWSPEIQLGLGGGETDQYEPFVQVGGGGAVSVAWYDRRNDTDNNTLVDLYKAFSQDGGGIFDPIERVTDVSFDIPPLNPNFNPGIANCYMGEYIGVAGDNQNFYYIWGDNRNIVTSATYPGGRPDPDVFFEAEPSPVVNDADLEIAKSDTPDPVLAGEEIVYTVDVENNGPDIALDVVVTDTLSTWVTYVSDTGGCDTSALPVLTCDVGDMASGDTASFTITVEVKGGVIDAAVASISNTATVDGIANDPDLGNNSEEETTEIGQADVAIVSFQAVSPPPEILVAEDLELTLRKVITNYGPYTPIDTELTLAATAPADSTVTPENATLTEDGLANENRIVDEVFTINCGAASSHTFTFDNGIEPLGALDPDASNNTAQETVEISCVVPVVINIKPASDPNSQNTLVGGVTTVAVLSTLAGEGGTPLDFDASTIDPLSVVFGPEDDVWMGAAGAHEAHNRGHIEDSYELDETTQDGDLDMVLHFRTNATGLEAGDTTACVKGQFADATGTHTFFGCDVIRIVR